MRQHGRKVAPTVSLRRQKAAVEGFPVRASSYQGQQASMPEALAEMRSTQLTGLKRAESPLEPWAVKENSS